MVNLHLFNKMHINYQKIKNFNLKTLFDNVSVTKEFYNKIFKGLYVKILELKRFLIFFFLKKSI